MLRLITLLLGISLLTSTLTTAQELTTLDELDKKSMKKFKKAKTEALRGDIAKAMKLYGEVLKKHPNTQEAQLNLAGLHYRSGDFATSEDLFRQALALTPSERPIIQYSLALALREQKKYAEAAELFDAYIALDSTDVKRLATARMNAANMHFAAHAIANPLSIQPEKLSDAVNSTSSEYLPALTGDGSQFIFTRRIRGQEDLYLSQVDSNGQFSIALPLAELNSELGNEGVHSISADGNYMVFTACGRMDGFGLCDLYYSKKENGEWTSPINMGKRVNSGAHDSQPALTADGRGLYFVSDRKGSIGGRDIWYTQRRPDGKWYIPVNLGKEINTNKNEESPFIHHDGVTLYFRSNGYPGMGDYDIYMSEWNKTWSEPKNLGYPINTENDEGALTVSMDGEWAYYSTDRSTGEDGQRKHLDIYRFKMPESIKPRPVTFVRGQVSDANSGQGMRASIVLKDLESDKVSQTIKTDYRGRYFVSLPQGKAYAFVVEQEGYVFHSEHFDLAEAFSVLEPYVLDIALQPIPIAVAETEAEPMPDTERPVVLKNVFFETGSADLLPQSMSEVRRLADLLASYPDAKIKVMGHTDNVGQEPDNLKLSSDRAAAVRAALIAEGIAAERISSAGMGESQPIADNATAAGRKLNRRTEFVWVR